MWDEENRRHCSPSLVRARRVGTDSSILQNRARGIASDFLLLKVGTLKINRDSLRPDFQERGISGDSLLPVIRNGK